MSRRELIRMTPEEVAAFLRDGLTITVATINADGSPHLVAMWYTLIDGKIAMWTYRKSQKAVNLRRDPRIVCLMETGTTYAELRGVQISGRATIIEDVAWVQSMGESLFRRNDNHGAPLTHEQERRVVAQAPKRVGVIVEPITIVSWDHSKLQGFY